MKKLLLAKGLPTKDEVLAHLRADVETWRRSHREIDGVIRDPEALHAIRCSEMAILMIRYDVKTRSRARDGKDRSKR